jgi:hypothetical protein
VHGYDILMKNQIDKEKMFAFYLTLNGAVQKVRNLLLGQRKVGEEPQKERICGALSHKTIQNRV